MFLMSWVERGPECNGNDGEYALFPRLNLEEGESQILYVLRLSSRMGLGIKMYLMLQVLRCCGVDAFESQEGTFEI